VAEPREVVGREQELEVVRAFAAGDGFATLVLEGEAGIGKTTLLREAVAAASGAGAGVLMAWPAAAEAALAFSGLGDLLAGALDEVVSELPAPQARRSTLPCFAERPASGRWIRTPSRRGS
jgi:primosomal protein N'